MLFWLTAAVLLVQITGGTVPAGRIAPAASPAPVSRPRPARIVRPFGWGGGYYGGSTEVIVVEKVREVDRQPVLIVSPVYQADRPRPELKEYTSLPPGPGLPLAGYLLAFRLL